MRVELPPWQSANVLVVGDVMLDRYWHGGTSRISPEAPVPVVHVQQVEERIGGAGNVALNVASLGGKVGVIGVIGDDEAGQVLTQRLEQARVRALMVRDAAYPTITKLRVMSRHQQLIRLDFEESNGQVPTLPLLDRMREHIQQAAVVVFSDYGKGALRESRPLIEMARAAGKWVLVDPKSQDFDVYRGANLITPNFAEFEAVVGRCRGEQEIVEKGMRLLRELRLDALLVTRGEHGMTLLQAQAEPLHLPTQAREVYDVTGAGDTVIAVLAAALAAGSDLVTATFLANAAAGIVVGKMGTATVSEAELRRALHDVHEFRDGIVSEEQLTVIVKESRTRGETIVMTNGCFDILHAGHVQYLAAARKLGDRLVVAVNDDASVKRLKGQTRPVNTLADRMAVLAALECVDWVVPFSEDTPERLICHVQPNLLVKGGDYAPEQVAGGDCVKRSGGEVMILPLKQGVSTSLLIDAIKRMSEHQ
jgi:D-beta-D-heptose 7-phosphate kinase/D-beta-D-heptose 1-phosphate adenosyltransferase